MPITPILGSVDEFEQWLADQQAMGEGYVEVALGGTGYPVMTFSFRDTAAVVHCFPTPDQVLLLEGDGIVDEGDVLELQVMDGKCPFTGTYISHLERARGVVREVLDRGSVDAVGRWELM